MVSFYSFFGSKLILIDLFLFFKFCMSDLYFQMALMGMETDSSSFPSSSSSFAARGKYDVFLSFRGEDTRYTLADLLYGAFNQKGINAFKDDEKLEKGKTISLELSRAIEES